MAAAAAASDFYPTEYNLAPFDVQAPEAKVVRALDPRLAISQSHDFIAKEGGANIQCQSYTADTATSSLLRWSVQTPGHAYGMDRHVYVEMSATINFAVTNTTGATIAASTFTIPDGGAFGLRQWPLASITDTANITFNSLQTSQQRAKIFHAMMHYGLDPEDRQSFLSATPHKPDISSDISGGAGTSRSPFSSYYTSGYEDGRCISRYVSAATAGGGGGGLVATVQVPQVLAGATITAILSVTWWEPLWTAPLTWGKRREQAIFNLNNFTVSLSIDDFNGIVEGSSTIPVNGLATGLTVAYAGAVPNDRTLCKLHMQFITPPLTMPTPRRCLYPYYECRDYLMETTLSVASRGTAVTNYFNNVTLTSLPKRLYFFVRPKRQITPTVRMVQTDTYDTITKITMTLANEAGRFSTYDIYDLYNVSRDNGLKDSFVDFVQTTGSVVCLEMGKDITMANPYHLASVQGNWQLGFQISYNCLADTADSSGAALVTPAVREIHMVAVQTGVIASDGEVFTMQVGALTEEMVATAAQAPSWANYTTETFYGSGLWDNIKSAFGSVKKYIRPALGLAGDVAGLVQKTPFANGAIGTIGSLANGANSFLGATKLLGEGRRRIRGGAIEMSQDALSARCNNIDKQLGT